MSASSNITGRPWGNTASYTDAEWHDIWRTLFDGSDNRGPLLFSTDNDFEVTQSDPVGMTITVATGTAVVGGLWGQNEEAVTLTVAANGGGANRYDLVFLHWERATPGVEQTLRIRIVDGTAATCALAVAPAANAIATYQTAGPPMTQWAVPLACITVVPAAAQILDADITDMREFCRFRTDPGDVIDGVTLDQNANNEIQVANAGIGVDQIAAAIAGDGLTGGAGSALDVNVDGVTLEVAADVVQVAATCAGDGLSGGAGAALDVNVDGATITIVGDVLQILSVTAAELTNRTRTIWVGANELRPGASNAPTWGTLLGLGVPCEGWIFPQSNSTDTDEYVVGHLKLPADTVTGSSYPAIYPIFSIESGVPAVLRGIGWGMRYVTSRACDGALAASSTLADGYATIWNTTLTRLCMVGNGSNTLSVTAGDYLDFRFSRSDLAAGTTPFPNSCLLLGFYLSYTADM